METKSKSQPILWSTIITVLLIGSTSYWSTWFTFLKKIWIWGGEVRQAQWDLFLDTFGEDQFMGWFVGK